MIQLIENGPEIPEEIETALDDDELVFFCGSGISVQNGLPVFEDLVKEICKRLRLNIDKKPLLKEAKAEKKYDAILDMIEEGQEFSVGRKALRKKVIEILSKTQGKPDIHKSLLELSALPDNKGYRLITTNFDKLFFDAGLKSKFADTAPKLAPPRKETWKNLTFLHGVINEKHDPKGENLILTRRDFGLAYFYDSWATRFVVQLFQNWKILFIGYSANDPVMNYLVSAISYENQRRRSKKNLKASDTNEEKIKPLIYAFAGYEKAKDKEKEKNRWKSIGVTPILYKKQGKDHSLLYNTVKRWAEIKKTGLRGKKHRLKEELKTPYDERIDKKKAQRIISFLKKYKDMAEYLSQINYSESDDPQKNKPVDISWLKAFSEAKDSKEENHQHKSNSFSNFKPKIEKKSLDKLIYRTQNTRWVDSSFWEPLSDFEIGVTEWLMHHLDKKALIRYLIDKSPHEIITIHPEFKQMICFKLKKIKNPKETLGERPFLFWRILTNQRDCSKNEAIGFKGGPIYNMNASYSYMKMQRFLHSLEPYIAFEKIWGIKNQMDSDQIYRPRLMVNMWHYPSNTEIKNEDILLRHAEDFSNLLKKAMELASFSGIIQDGKDLFFIQRPSVASHEQNNNLEAWLYLIDLVRDSFDIAMEKDRKLADLLLKKWLQYPYSLFQRLILYAVTKYNSLNEKIALDLFKKNPTVLWSITCQYEVLNYLQERPHSKDKVAELLNLISKDPPSSLLKKMVNKKIFKEIGIHQNLSCIKNSGVQLPKDKEKLYKEIQSRYNLKPENKDDDSFKFPFYTTDHAPSLDFEKRYHKLTNEEIFNDIKHKSDVQMRKRAFCHFIKEVPKGVKRGFEILSMFDKNDLNSAPFWRSFLYETSMLKDIETGSEYFLKSLKKIDKFNDKFIKECLWSLIDGLKQKIGPVYTKEGKNYFKKWWFRLWHRSAENNEDLEKESDFLSQVLSQAFNSKSGKLTEIIFHVLWSKFPDSKAPKNGKIPKEIREYFEFMIQKGKDKDPFVLFWFGYHLNYLWFLDSKWTKENLKPVMADWETNKKTCHALWGGYFYRMRLNPDFVSDFKKEFFQLLLHGKEFYKIKETAWNYIGYQSAIAEIFFILTGGKWMPNAFEENEIEEIICSLDDTGLWEDIAKKIWGLLENSEKGKSSILWSEKIKPWIKNFWPKETNKKTPKIAEYLSLAVLYCEDKFSDALEFLEDKIEDIPKSNQNNISYHIKENKLADVFKNHPKDLLRLLIWNFPEEKIYFTGEEIKEALDKIKEKHPQIEQDTNYRKLREKLSD